MKLRRVIAIGGGIVLVSGMASAGQSGAPRSAWDRTYSDVQADRGEQAYGQTCSHCHGLSLEGDGAREIPTLVGNEFMRHWRGKTVRVLFDSLLRSMPADDRGSLTPAGAADLIAYLLRANGGRSGDTALPADREALAGVVFDEQ